MKYIAPILILIVGVAIYSNSFRVPILFDDEPSIQKNETIRSLWPLWKPLATQQDHDFTMSGRPIANFTLAINYAISGEDTWSYHVFNLAVHILAALTLFGLVRRTLMFDFISEQFRHRADWWALIVAMIWLAHPIQTIAVTYIVQRVESLSGLFYLLTLYFFVRGTTSRVAMPWFIFSVISCVLGMGTKEIMVSAPIAVLLYDRQFVAQSFADAIRKRWLVYLGLFSTWVLLAFLVFTGPRLTTVGETHIPPIDYLKTQCWAIVHYLSLCIWPNPLVFDYGQAVNGVTILSSFREYAMWAAITCLLVALTLFCLWKRKWIGFLGSCFFMILAPSSSIVPVLAEPVAEHRMYLPLAAVLCTIIFGSAELYRKLTDRKIALAPIGIAASILIAILGFMTFDRNRDFHSVISIWTDTVAKRPENARAHFNLGLMLSNEGRLREATAHYQESVRLHPNNPIAHNNLANALARQGRFELAIDHYFEAIHLQGDYPEARHNLELAIRLRDQELRNN